MLLFFFQTGFCYVTVRYIFLDWIKKITLFRLSNCLHSAVLGLFVFCLLVVGEKKNSENIGIEFSDGALWEM